MYATTATYRPEEMEGRSYGTDSSSFLSVDAYVQAPSNAQGFNRYAYCAYNPLRFVDPSGWVVDWYLTENGKYVLDKNVTGVENTPQGGTYIGPDLLSYFNIPSTFEHIKEKKIGVGFDGVVGETDHNGVIYPNQPIGGVPTVSSDFVAGTLHVEVSTTNYDTEEASGTSQGAKVFCGLTFNFGFTQTSRSMNFKGCAYVYCNDDAYKQRLEPMNSNIAQIQAEGTEYTQASIFIPADKIKSKDYFIEANIRAGSPNPAMFRNPKVVDMKWNLKKRAIFNPF